MGEMRAVEYDASLTAGHREAPWCSKVKERMEGDNAEGAPTSLEKVQPPDGREVHWLSQAGQAAAHLPLAGREQVVSGAPAGAEAKAFEVGGLCVVGTGRENSSPGGPGPRRCV